MYIEKRRNKYYALHTIPADVREAFQGNVRFTTGLDTGDRRVAETRARLLEVRWRRLIAQARSQSTDQVEKNALFWRKLLEDAPEHERSLLKDAIADEAQGRIERAASRQGIIDERDPRFAELPEHAEAMRFHSIATGKLVRLGEHLDEYLVNAGNEAKTLDMKRSSIRRFCEEFPYVSDVERKAVQAWVNKQALDGRKPKTVRRVLSELRGYWTYLLSIGAASENTSPPFEKLSLPKTPKNGKGDERQPFKAADVVRLHRAAVALEDRSLVDLIELGMWTGARIEELCALDIKKVHDDHIEIEDAKTPAGWRQVPIHSKLQVTVKRLLGDRTAGYVLSGLTANKYGDRSNAVGKRFGRLKVSLGFGPEHVFHSIRRTVATQLENAGVAEGVAADIIGHEKTTMTYGLYSGGASLEVKREAIEKLSYPDAA